MIRIIEFYQGTPDAVMERLCSTISKAFEMIPFHVRSAAGRFICISKALHIVLQTWVHAIMRKKTMKAAGHVRFIGIRWKTMGVNKNHDIKR
ncbi:hypothetical protein [Parablautia muri]|uniref:Uncharacterized protein n=1 Tax=Parablautia muri TaxID=2320879 RepID=A0A9X5BIB8_9FIRM|nr:hypothetical protein [Parablautia muri]NBJ94564.1 hypothetical protein [Parablautia muri]